MSVYLIVNSLIKRGLVEKNKKGGRWIYSTTSILISTSPNLSLFKERDKIFGKGLNENKLEEMYENYKRFVNENFGVRVLGLQTTKSFNTAINKIGEEKWAVVNEMIKKNEIIMDVIVPENVIADSKKGDKKWRESIIGRKTSVKIVPEFTMNFNSEILLGKKWGLVTNWESETQIEIHDSNILEMQKMFITALRGFGKNVDVNTILKKNDL
jgi:hypothetical protein